MSEQDKFCALCGVGVEDKLGANNHHSHYRHHQGQLIQNINGSSGLVKGKDSNGSYLKAIVCELCHSNDLIKQDGLFTCQHCGTKYSPEDARKLMIDRPVEVTGSVRIDNTANLEKALKNARRAKDDNNFEHAQKYYQDVLHCDPENWEALFYYTYSKAMQSNVANIVSGAQSVSNCLSTVLKYIKVHVNEFDLYSVLTQTSNDLATVSLMFCNAAVNHYDDITRTGVLANSLDDCVTSVISTSMINFVLADEIGDKFGHIYFTRETVNRHYKLGIKLLYHFDNAKHVKDDLLQKYIVKAKQYDPNYSPPKRKWWK